MTASQLESLASKLERFEDELPENVHDAVEDNMDGFVRQMETELSANDTHWRGQLWLSLFSESKRTGDQSWSFRAGSKGEIAYWNKYVEFGTGSHWGRSGYPIPSGVYRYSSPSFGPDLVAAIEEWVATKPIVPKYVSRDELPWTIAQSISVEGTSGQPFVRPAWFRTKSKLSIDVVRGVNKAVMRVKR